MKLMNIFSVFVCLPLCAFIPAAYANDILLNDNFDSENNGRSELSYDRFANWYITRGAVNLLGRSNWQYELHPRNGLYLDFDTLSESNTSQYGVRVGSKKEFALTPGNYRLNFDILNLSFSNPNLNRTVLVSLGDVYNETFTLPENQSFQNIERIINVSIPSEGSLVFEKPVIKVDGNIVQNGIGLDSIWLTKISDKTN